MWQLKLASMIYGFIYCCCLCEERVPVSRYNIKISIETLGYFGKERLFLALALALLCVFYFLFLYFFLGGGNCINGNNNGRR